jgi:hypothetical protein
VKWAAFPGVFGVFYQSDRPTKNALEKKWIESSREKTDNSLPFLARFCFQKSLASLDLQVDVPKNRGRRKR